MKKWLPVLLSCAMLTLGTAFASGPGASPSPFRDFPYYAESYDNPERIPWYADAAVEMFRLGVVKGFEDGTFRGNNGVTRAELVTMLSRIHRFIQNPHTKEWGAYKNSFYAIWYPKIAGTSHEVDADGCSSHVKLPTDFMYPVICHDMNTNTLEALIVQNGNQFAEGDKRRESRDSFTLNGRQALMVTVTTLDHPEWFSQSVYVVDEGRKKIYELSNGAMRDPNFENFYLSFKVQ